MTIPSGASIRPRRRPLAPRLWIGLAGLAALAAAALAAAPAASADSCPNAAFRIGYGALLPDCRAYEQATPADKDNTQLYQRPGEIFGSEGAADGSRFAYLALEAPPTASSTGLVYMATRGSSDWPNMSLIPPQSTEGGALCGAFKSVGLYTPDMSKGVLLDGSNQSSGCGTDDPPLVPGEPAGVQNLFLRDNVTNTYQLISLNPVTGPPADANPDATSTDDSHVVFDEVAQLTPDAPAAQDNLYDWSGGTVKLVNIVAGSPVLGAIAGGGTGNFAHAVSDNGARIFFTANGKLYVRKNGVATSQVDAPDGGAGPGGGGQFMFASTDGSTAFFTDDASAGLTADTVPGSGINLYAYDVASKSLTDLTPAADAEVQGVSGISDDGSSVYFVANGHLAGGATAGAPNLYLARAGAVRFVATLDPGDGCDWTLSCLTARVSPSGGFIGFDSVKNQTGFDSTGHTEIYLYNSTSHALACASCAATGTTPTSNTTLYGPEAVAINSSVLNLRRQVSDSGQVFFDTFEPLLPTDSNGRKDVYAYEGGALHLLSTGTSSTDSFFGDASTSGNDVFFSTAQQLVPQDQDGAVDLYDARVDGGFPSPSSPAPCVGDACKPAPSGAPAEQSPGSQPFQGQGNSNHAKLTVNSITAAQAKKLARTGKLTLTVHVNKAGKVKAELQARLHHNGFDTVDKAAKKAHHSGKLKLKLKLSKQAKKRLANKGHLVVRTDVRFHDAHKVNKLTLKESH